MLRQPGSSYEAGRSTTLLKVKTFHDAEGRVVEHMAGKGRHVGRLGAVVVELSSGLTFSDEGDFWQTRDLAVLARNVGHYDAMIAGLAGVLKDAAEASGLGFDSAMLGRADFEHLEAQAMKIDSLAGHLEKLRAALVP